MVYRNALAALAATGLVLSTGAQAAAPASIDNARSASPIRASEGIATWTLFLAVIILIGVAGVLLANTDKPASP